MQSLAFRITSIKQTLCAFVCLIVCSCEWVCLVLDAQHVAPAFLAFHISPLHPHPSSSLQHCLCHDSSLSRESHRESRDWPCALARTSALKRNTTRSEHNNVLSGHYCFFFNLFISLQLRWSQKPSLVLWNCFFFLLYFLKCFSGIIIMMHRFKGTSRFRCTSYNDR